jgi:hypothetical protein
VASVDEVLRRGWEALAAADWDGARMCFEDAAELDETAEVLDGLSQAVHFQGDHLRAIELKERAFAAHRRRGKRVEAAELRRRSPSAPQATRPSAGSIGSPLCTHASSPPAML